jgi:hypothetical protein
MEVYSDGEGFLLAKYGDFFVLGQCKKQRSEFKLKPVSDGLEFKQVSRKSNLEIKICFQSSDPANEK